MAGCNCCVTYDSQIIVGDADISNQTISISVDSSQEIIWEDKTDQECDPLGDEKVYLYGPGKASVQITAYPFAQYTDYTFGFECPVSVNVNIPWRYVYDCRGCEPCIDPATGEQGIMRKGRYIGLPMKKKQISVTGDIENSNLFEVGGCAVPTTKFTLTAGPQSIITPQPTMQYSWLKYHGLPFEFDTDQVKTPFIITINNGSGCSWASGFRNVRAYLTSFSFSFAPPQVPTCSLSFDVLVSFCPTC